MAPDNDWAGFASQTAAQGERIQIVGDDIFVTNSGLLAYLRPYVILSSESLSVSVSEILPSAEDAILRGYTR